MTEVTDERFGRLTDEAFARSRARIGIPERPLPPHNLEVTADGTRHFCYGYGDDNPLYCDPAHGKGTRWGTLIAPPNFLYTMGENVAGPPTPEQKQALKGDPFAGLGSYQAMMEFEWFRPLLLGDRCQVLRAQVGVQDKPSTFGGRTSHVTHAFLHANGAGEVHAVRRGTWINAERHATKKRSEGEAKPAIDFTTLYTAEQLAEIDAAYDAETRRGAEPRYWEDVQVGDEIQPRVKGPLTVTDVVVWHIGWGMQLTPPGAFGISREIRRKVPGLYPPNARNIPDTVQRLHWEPQRAHELGIPMTYDYGAMRETWLTHALTEWMGDDAWLWKLSCQHRRFNYIGDTSWVRGRVVGKAESAAGHAVHLEVRVENQRGETTTPGTAVVLLPTRESAVTLPTPPADTLQEGHARSRHRPPGRVTGPRQGGGGRGVKHGPPPRPVSRRGGLPGRGERGDPPTVVVVGGQVVHGVRQAHRDGVQAGQEQQQVAVDQLGDPPLELRTSSAICRGVKYCPGRWRHFVCLGGSSGIGIIWNGGSGSAA